MKNFFGAGCPELRLKLFCSQVHILLITSIDKNGDCCFWQRILYHVNDLPVLFIDCVYNRPDYVDKILLAGYFWPQDCVEVKTQDGGVILIEKKMFHHEESDNYIGFSLFQELFIKNLFWWNNFRSFDGLPNGLDMSFASLLKNQLQISIFKAEVKLNITILTLWTIPRTYAMLMLA